MANKTNTKGLVIVYTGDGKGKTTAAMGLALRASGYDRQVLVIQFVKRWFTGEKAAMGKLPTVEFIQAGKGFYKIRGDSRPDAEHREAANQALNLAKQKLASNAYDVVILDEVIGSATGGLIAEADILELIKTKPPATDLVLTGHQGHLLPRVLEAADLVTEMKKLKHPYDKGILAKESIDY